MSKKVKSPAIRAKIMDMKVGESHFFEFSKDQDKNVYRRDINMAIVCEVNKLKTSGEQKRKFSVIYDKIHKYRFMVTRVF